MQDDAVPPVAICNVLLLTDTPTNICTFDINQVFFLLHIFIHPNQKHEYMKQFAIHNHRNPLQGFSH